MCVVRRRLNPSNMGVVVIVLGGNGEGDFILTTLWVPGVVETIVG